MNLNIGPKIFDKVAGSRPFNWLNKPSIAGAASTIALISTTSKDIVSTYYYVTQSLKNEKIPEDKRKFVAALDLSNGIMNATFGVGMGIGMKKLAEKMFNTSKMKAMFEATSEKFAKIANKNISFETFEGAMKRNRAYAKGGLTVLAALVGSQIIGKRIITPLIATPMASWFKGKMEKSTGTKNTPELDHIIDTRMPKSLEDFKMHLNDDKDDDDD